MPMSYNPVVERRPNLALAYEELLTAIVRLRSERQNVSDEKSFRANAIAGLQAAVQRGIDRGYAQDDVNKAGYAVIALLDESVLNLKKLAADSSSKFVFESWAGRPLQQDLWREDVAGEAFFKYLQDLMGRRDSAELADVLEVFYLCILLGYRGRYGVVPGGEESISAIGRSIEEKILRCRGGIALLSPRALLPRDLPEPIPPDRWLKWLTWTVTGVALFSLAVFVICKLVLMSGSSQLQSLAGR